MSDADTLHDRLLDSASRHLARGIDAVDNGDIDRAKFEARQCEQAIEGAKSLGSVEVTP